MGPSASGVERFIHRWSTQDLLSVDHAPFAGLLRRGAGQAYVATGYGGRGLTNGTAAGLLVADLILGRSSRFAGLYDPNRVKLFAGGVDLARENAQVGLGSSRIGPRAAPPEVWDLLLGEGRVARLGGDLLAVHRREDRELQVVSAVCTHSAASSAGTPPTKLGLPLPRISIRGGRDRSGRPGRETPTLVTRGRASSTAGPAA